MTTQGPRQAPQPLGWNPSRLAASLVIADRYAHRGARRLNLSPSDRDDLRQDILLTLLKRSARFDSERARWDAFATVVARHAVADRARNRTAGLHPTCLHIDLDAFPAGASVTQRDEVDPDLRLDLIRVGADIPPPVRQLLELVLGTADVAAAQRHAPGSCAAFYRAMAELRCWLHAAGLRPARAMPARAPSTATL